MDGNQSPKGHVIERFSAPGGGTLCANCNKKVEYCYGSREESWFICKKCHTDLLMIYEVARLKGVPIALPNSEVEMVRPGSEDNAYGSKGPYGTYGYGAMGPVTTGVHEIELRVTYETLQAQGNNIHTWFDERLAQKAQIANIPPEHIKTMEANMMIFHARGRHMTELSDFERLNKERGDYPLVFKFPQTQVSSSGDNPNLSRELVLNKLLAVNGFAEDMEVDV